MLFIGGVGSIGGLGAVENLVFAFLIHEFAVVVDVVCNGADLFMEAVLDEPVKKVDLGSCGDV